MAKESVGAGLAAAGLRSPWRLRENSTARPAAVLRGLARARGEALGPDGAGPSAAFRRRVGGHGGGAHGGGLLGVGRVARRGARTGASGRGVRRSHWRQFGGCTGDAGARGQRGSRCRDAAAAAFAAALTSLRSGGVGRGHLRGPTGSLALLLDARVAAGCQGRFVWSVVGLSLRQAVLRGLVELAQQVRGALGQRERIGSKHVPSHCPGIRDLVRYHRPDGTFNFPHHAQVHRRGPLLHHQ